MLVLMRSAILPHCPSYSLTSCSINSTQPNSHSNSPPKLRLQFQTRRFTVTFEHSMPRIIPGGVTATLPPPHADRGSPGLNSLSRNIHFAFCVNAFCGTTPPYAQVNVQLPLHALFTNSPPLFPINSVWLVALYTLVATFIPLILTTSLAGFSFRPRIVIFANGVSNPV